MSSMHSASLLAIGLALVCVAAEPAAKPKTNHAAEPLAAKFAPEKAAAYLDAVAGAWTRDHQCGSCHTNYPYMVARPVLKGGAEGTRAEVRKFFEERIAHWDRGEKGDAPRWDAEVVATAATLALQDARTTGKLHPLTRQALDRTWTLQKPTGEWNWLKCDWPPLEHDDYYGSVYTTIAVGLAPDGYAATDKARAGLDKLRAYFKKTAPPDLHHKALLLWAAQKVDGLMSAEEKAAAVKELRALQRDDGGWALPALGKWKRHNGTANDPKADSDGYGTGFVVFVLRQAGVPADDEQIQRGVRWLRTHQRESGSWFTRSLNNDKAHYISHAGTAFAVLALDACGALAP